MARTEAIGEVVLGGIFCSSRPTGLRPSLGHSVCQSLGPAPPQSIRLPSVPVQALGVSALRLYALDGRMFSEASFRKESVGVGLLERALKHTRSVLELIRPIANGQIAFLTAQRSLKHIHGA